MTVVPSHDHSKWYYDAATPEIEQGDILFDCAVPVVSWNLEIQDYDVNIDFRHIVVMSFTCDMIPQGKNKVVRANQVLVAPLAISKFVVQEKLKEASEELGQANKGKTPSMYAIPRRSETELPNQHYLVDFRNFITMPLAALKHLKRGVKAHVRLHSPYREHFALAVANFFNRVALDDDPNFDYSKDVKF